MLSKGPSRVSVTTDSLIIDEIEYDVDIPHTVENIQAAPIWLLLGITSQIPTSVVGHYNTWKSHK